jgi:hypothetical protein
MSALSYMQRRASGTYEFRKRLPESLAGKPAPAAVRAAFSELVNPTTGCFKRELVRSLETKDVAQAKRLNHREAVRVTGLIDSAVKTLAGVPAEEFTDAELRLIEDEIVAELLGDDAAEREDGDDRRVFQTPEDRARWPNLVSVDLNPLGKGMSSEHFYAYGELIEEQEQEYRQDWARSDPAIVRAETRIVYKKYGKPIVESSPHFRKVGLVVLKAHVRAYDLKRKRQAGQIIETPVVVQDRGPKLSEALASWKAGGTSKRGKKPATKSVVEAELAVRSFTQLHGDMCLGDITREQARTFRDAMASVPKSLPKALRDLPLPILLKRDLSHFPQRSVTTVNKFMGLLGGIVSQSERDGVLDKLAPAFVNPFTSKMLLPVIEGEDEREPFNKADLTAIFKSPVYSAGDRPAAGGGEASFWLPLIALLSGLRLNEIAQLRLCDIRQDDTSERWFFDIARSGGRRTKTASSIRAVPMHSELIRIGLLNYRDQQLESADAAAPLWPEVGLSAQWSKWFGRYLRKKVGITDPAKVFHSFRHTFKRMTRDAGLPEEVHDALTGHSGHGNVGRTYGRGFSLTTLVVAMDKVVCPISLSTVQWYPLIRERQKEGR